MCSKYKETNYVKHQTTAAESVDFIYLQAVFFAIYVIHHPFVLH